MNEIPLALQKGNDLAHHRRMLRIGSVILSFQTLGLVFAYVYANYFGRGTFADAYLFRANDSTSLARGKPSSALLGNHHFGDFVWPWSTTRDLGRGGYFGLAQLYFVAVKNVSPVLGISILVLASFILVLAAIATLDCDLQLSERVGLALMLFVLTQPVLLAVDRGQIHLLMGALLILGFSLQSGSATTERRRWGIIIVGAAASMKIVPVVFLFFFLRRRYRSLFPYGLASFIIALILPLTTIRSGMASLFAFIGLRNFPDQDSTDLLYRSDSYFQDTKAFNHSFKALLGVLRDHSHILHQTFASLFNGYSAVALTLVIISVILILSSRISDVQALAICAILTVRIIPISGGYTLIAFLVPVFWLLIKQSTEDAVVDRFTLFFLAITLMPVQFPLRFGYFSQQVYTFSSLVGPLLSIVYLTQLLVRAFLPKRFNMSSRNERQSDAKHILQWLLAKLSIRYGSQTAKGL